MILEANEPAPSPAKVPRRPPNAAPPAPNDIKVNVIRIG